MSMNIYFIARTFVPDDGYEAGTLALSLEGLKGTGKLLHLVG